MKTVESKPKNLQRRQIVLASGALLGLGGCANVAIPGGPETMQVVPMTDSPLVPANIDPSRRTRVVVLPSEDSPTARGAGLAAIASAALETILGAGVEVVERNLAGKLDQELKLAEMRGSGSYGGPDVADYAIRIVMGTAGWNSEFVPASNMKILGKEVNTPAGHTHTAKSAMTLRIYSLPALRLMEQIDIDGRYSATQQPSSAGPAQGANMMRAATESGVRSKRSQVLNEFSPKGYITERRVKDKVSIFRVQIGKSTGAKTGDTVEIFTYQKVDTTYDEVKVGAGVMSEVVGREGSWILVSDEKVAARVKKFDFVKVKNGGIFDSLPGMIPGMPNMFK